MVWDFKDQKELAEQCHSAGRTAHVKTKSESSKELTTGAENSGEGRGHGVWPSLGLAWRPPDPT